MDYKDEELICFIVPTKDKEGEFLYALMNAHYSLHKQDVFRPFIVHGDHNLQKPFDIIDNKYLIVPIDDREVVSKNIYLFSLAQKLFPCSRGFLRIDERFVPNMDHLQTICRPDIFQILSSDPACFYLSKNALPLFTKSDGYLREDNRLKKTYDSDDSDQREKLFSYDIKRLPHVSVFNRENRPFVFLHLLGRLGNQLFISMLGYSLIRRTKSIVMCVAPPTSEIVSMMKGQLHFILPNCCSSLSIANYHQRGSFVHMDDAVYEALNVSHQHYNIHGYYQNPKYFDEYRLEIQDFLKDNCIERINSIDQRKDFRSLYFIHVRRGDYIHDKKYEIDLDVYMRKAIDYIYDKNSSDVDDDISFLVFSDDIPFCRQYHCFQDIKCNFVSPTLSASQCICLMSLCEKGGICANSTFSWWGAYMNNKKNKIIIMPKTWISSLSFEDNHIYFDGVVTL